MLKMLWATVKKNVVTWATWCLEFVHLWDIQTQVVYNFSQSLHTYTGVVC